MRAQGFISAATLDEALRSTRVAEAQLDSTQQQLASTRPTGSDTALAQATLAQAEAAAAAAQARLRYTLISAPLAGTLITRNVEPGAVVQPGKVLMVLSPAGATQLVVQIDERNLQLLRLGQPALISADAYPNERFAAQLSYINPGIDAGRGAVEVKLQVLVPMSALHDADTGEPWVLKVVGRHAKRQALKLGLRSNGVAEVLQGLQAGDQVVPASAPKTIVDGLRIRAVAP